MDKGPAIYIVGAKFQTMFGEKVMTHFRVGRVIEKDVAEMPQVAKSHQYLMDQSFRPEAANLPEAKLFRNSKTLFVPPADEETFNRFFAPKPSVAEMPHKAAPEQIDESVIGENSEAMGFDAFARGWYPITVLSIIENKNSGETEYRVRWRDSGSETILKNHEVKADGLSFDDDDEKNSQNPLDNSQIDAKLGSAAQTPIVAYAQHVLQTRRAGGLPLAFDVFLQQKMREVTEMPRSSKLQPATGVSMDLLVPGSKVIVTSEGVQYRATFDRLAAIVIWDDGGEEGCCDFSEIVLAPVASAKMQPKVAPAKSAKKGPSAGDAVTVKSPSDGQWYPATISADSPEGDVAGHFFAVYEGDWAGQGEYIPVADIKPREIPAKSGKLPKTSPAATAATSNSLHSNAPATALKVRGNYVVLQRPDGRLAYVVEAGPKGIKARYSAGPGRPIELAPGEFSHKNAALYIENA